MFKKTKIAAATIALLGAAAVQNVSAIAIDDTGNNAQVLIFPYYNTNNGFQTSFNIRNIKNEYKAVKIRFRESKASNDVLDFNVYLSPFDHYSLTLTKQASGKVLLQTTDTSCTYPTIPAGGVEFQSSVYTNTTDADAREGYVEVIEMGVVSTSATVTGTGLTPDAQTIVSGIKHASGKPKDCSYVSKAWSQGVFTQGGAVADANFTVAGKTATNTVTATINTVTIKYYSDETAGDGIPNNIAAPTGGIQGYSILFNVAAGAIFVGDPVAIKDYSEQAQHYKSDDTTFYLLPSLASGTNSVVVIPQGGGGTIAGSTTAYASIARGLLSNGTGGYAHLWANVRADWGLSDPNVAPNTAVPSGVNPFPISDILAVDGLHNDYFINPAFGAATDWVVTLPMKKHGIYNGFRFDGLPIPTTASTHPVKYFVAKTGTPDVSFSSVFYDREEGVPSTSVGFSPAVQAGVATLDREVNILTFTNPNNATSPVLGSDSPKKFSLDNGFVQGWAQLTYTGTDLATLATSAAAAGTVDFTVGDTWLGGAGGVPAGIKTGVPTLGFAAIRGTNGVTTAAVGETTRHVMVRNR